MAEITGSKAALPAFKEGDGAGIKKLLLQSNEVEGRTVDISTGLLTFSYYESILQDVVRATVTFLILVIVLMEKLLWRVYLYMELKWQIFM